MQSLFSASSSINMRNSIGSTLTCWICLCDGFREGDGDPEPRPAARLRQRHPLRRRRPDEVLPRPDRSSIRVSHGRPPLNVISFFPLLQFQGREHGRRHRSSVSLAGRRLQGRIGSAVRSQLPADGSAAGALALPAAAPPLPAVQEGATDELPGADHVPGPTPAAARHGRLRRLRHRPRRLPRRRLLLLRRRSARRDLAAGHGERAAGGQRRRLQLRLRVRPQQKHELMLAFWWWLV